MRTFFVWDLRNLAQRLPFGFLCSRERALQSLADCALSRPLRPPLARRPAADRAAPEGQPLREIPQLPHHPGEDLSDSLGLRESAILNTFVQLEDV